MRLRSRLLLAMVACALLPLAGAGLLARTALTRRYEQDDERRRETTLGRVQAALGERSASQRRALARFCAHDYLVDRTLLQLETGQFNEGAREELDAVLPEVKAALGFDVLSLVRSDGVVLASAHYPGQAGTRDRETFRTATSARREDAVVRRVRVRGPSGPRDILALESFCVARRGRVAVAVAGGQTVDVRLLEAVASEQGVTARVLEGAPGAPGGEGDLSRVLPLRDADGRVVASVVVATSDKALRELIAGLDALAAGSALLAMLTAVLLAVLLAPPLARPIGEVADAADRIAQGDRTVRIDVRAGGEVGRLVAAFNHMTRELDAADARLRRAERLAAWRDIARQMAHEIKNPLTPIRMAVEMLRKAWDRKLPDFDELFDEQTRIVLDEVDRLRRLVENFSRFARAPRPRLEPVALAEVVAHVTELHAGESVAVTHSLEGGLPEVRADRDQLTQVLVNLVANGCHAAAERAKEAPSKGPAAVTVRARSPREGAVELTVEDNGGGIPSSVMAKLFEPYVTTKEGGTGLGLAIAYRIVTDHGGTITPETGPDGTRFVLELPVAGPPEAAAEREEAS